jgi:predicted ATPase
MITRLAIAAYRSLRDVRVELGRLNIVTGPNGSGKSSLYRALRLLADIAQGRIIRSLAAEGGLQSTLWAGPEVFSQGMKRGAVPIEGTLRRGPVSLRLGFSSPEYGYAIDLGLPPLNRATAFSHDPQIKAESLWTGETLGRANEIARRRGSIVQIRDDAGAWGEVFRALEPFDSMVTHSSSLIAAIDDAGANRRITLSKTLGETIIEEDEDRPGWNWPAR